MDNINLEKEIARIHSALEKALRNLKNSVGWAELYPNEDSWGWTKDCLDEVERIVDKLGELY